MKKNEYVAPEMEIVEIEGQYSILAGSPGDVEIPGGNNEGMPDYD